MCEVGVCSVYITQDTEEKNAACVLLYQYSCISSGSLLQGWTLLRCWHLYVCLLSKVGMEAQTDCLLESSSYPIS